ncbi:MAG TPA: hypothetical protein PKA63_09225 [Oligoflexia bacterium]|nr:hypothetical protein [Oligoflexia bacterium]HMP48834.1 hypothetical protein [Oligoflexia bacterium]
MKTANNVFINFSPESGGILVVVSLFMGLFITLMTLGMDSYVKLQARAEQQNIGEYSAVANLGTWKNMMEKADQMEQFMEENPGGLANVFYGPLLISLIRAAACIQVIPTTIEAVNSNNVFGYSHKASGQGGFIFPEINEENPEESEEELNNWIESLNINLGDNSYCNFSFDSPTANGENIHIEIDFGVWDSASYVPLGQENIDQINASRITMSMKLSALMKFFSKSTNESWGNPTSVISHIAEQNGKRQLRVVRQEARG